MKGFVKVIIAGAIIIGIGIAVLLIALGLNGWSFAPDFKTEEFTSTQENTSLAVDLSAGKLKIEYHDGENIQISYPTAKGYETTIKEENGKLSIEGNKHKWYTFTWGVTIPETVIKIPENKITEVTVKLNAGTVDMTGGAFEKVKIEVNAGTLHVGQITDCELLDINVNAGTVNAEGVSSTSLVCEVNAGTAGIKNIDCTATDVKVSAGSANVSFTGAKADYSADVDVSAGSCNGLSTQTGGGKNIKIKVGAGSCNVSFAG